jgi:pSer/pThr/pTyr-binding forkhead associated (FHA) protein/type II secretory pathway predicted ATPase ExeA
MGETRRLVSPARVFARPTADQIWLGPAQQAALSHLSEPARMRVLIGPPASGKTTILNHMAGHTAADAVVLQCRGPKDHANEVLTSLLVSADLGPWELSEIDQRNLFTVFVQQRRSQGRRVVLLIDDAHLFKAGAWEEVERLLAFTIDRRPAVEVLLAGPPSLSDELALLPFTTPQETVTHRLEPPSQAELFSYIEWRLARFDIADLMTPVAGHMIARLAGGRYTCVDVLCQMCLLLLRQLSLPRIDARVARQAVATLAARHAAKLEPQAASEHPQQQLDVPPQGYLLISRGGKVMTRVTLGQRTLIGRSEHNDVCLPSPYLSRHHGVIVGTPQGYYVMDLNSVNGLTLNGRPVERAVLCDQDLLVVGPFRLKVQIPEWLAHDNPFPTDESLADTAMMPTEVNEPTVNVRRVK